MYPAKIAVRTAVLALALALHGCSNYQKVLRSSDREAKFEAAKGYYASRDYYRALPLFEELLTLYKGTMHAEEVYYYYAYCHYGMEDYILAGYHFRNYVKTFPNGAHAEECQFLNAYCLYLQSPISSLDQGSTKRALTELQLFINRYPESERVARCNELMDNLTRKLQKKEFDIASLYYRTGDYKSAVTALKNSLALFPGSEYEEEILFLVFKSAYLYAMNSIENKKAERLKEAEGEFRIFAARYGSSKFLPEAKALKETIDRLTTNP